MTLCNNFQRKWGVGIFSGVGVFSRGYSTSTMLGDCTLEDTSLQAKRVQSHAMHKYTADRDWNTYNSDEIHCKYAAIAKLPLQVQPLSQYFFGSHSSAFMFEVMR